MLKLYQLNLYLLGEGLVLAALETSSETKSHIVPLTCAYIGRSD